MGPHAVRSAQTFRALIIKNRLCRFFMMRKRLFVILCPDITGEALDKQLSEMRKLSENTSDVSFAFGTAYCTENHNIREAIQTADERMYKDKEAYYRNHPEKDRRARKKD